MFTARTLSEGKWPILGLAALMLATLLWCPVAWAPLVPGALLAFVISFFRDPERTVPADPQAIVAPADGKVVEIKQDNDATMLAIFLSIFDVHVQRAPVDGEIKSVEYVKGKFLDARNPQAAVLNENRVISIEASGGYRVKVRQIAGLIARRIVGWAGEGARLAKGERLGMIRFGSRVELFLPAGVEITVKPGDHVQGAASIVARKR
jgi:phosphatidylserine decarboxylase